MRKDSSDFNTSFISEGGSFIQNKDYFAFIELDDFACWVAADGIDSEEEINSAEIAVKSVFTDFSDNPTMSRKKLKEYIINANEELEKQSRRVALQASLILVVTDYTKVIWAVSGNVRLYHIRNDQVNFRSEDQSYAQMLVDSDMISRREADIHPERNNLLNYLGTEDEFNPFVSKPYDLNDSDILLIGTPGFWENLSEEEIKLALKDAKDPRECVEALEEKILSKKPIVLNNYTIASIFVDKVFVKKKKNVMVYVKRVAAILIPILIALAIILIYRSIQLKNVSESRAEIVKHETAGDELAESGYYEDALAEYNKAKPFLKKAKSKPMQEAIDSKINISQLLVSGDKSLDAKEYAKAKSIYIKARTKAKASKDYPLEEIELRIKKVEQCEEVAEIKKEAEGKFEDEDYASAKKLYEKAVELADKAKLDEEKKELKAKLEETNNKLTEIDKAKKDLIAKNHEKRGDAYLADEQYEEAIKAYTSGGQVYESINNDQGVLALERKIGQVQDAKVAKAKALEEEKKAKEAEQKAKEEEAAKKAEEERKAKEAEAKSA